MKLKRIGIDLAKQVFQLHGVDSYEQVKLKKQVKRQDMLDIFRQIEPCLVAMEACGSSHYWARELKKLGHEVRLIAPQFVAVKTADQQAQQALHRVRSRVVRARTALANEIRGLLGEFGITMCKGIAACRRVVAEVLEDSENGLPGMM